MIALTLVFWGYLKKKKKNQYILSLWKGFFLTVGRSTRCTIFLSTYISLQKVQYSAVCTYNLNTNTSHIKLVLFHVIVTLKLKKKKKFILNVCVTRKQSWRLYLKYIGPNAYKNSVFVACFLKHGEELSGSLLFLFSLLSKCKITRHIWGKHTAVKKTM